MNELDFDRLQFFAEDVRIRNQILQACRSILRRQDLKPQHIVAVGGFVWLFEHLPFTRSEPSGRLALVRHTNETEWHSFDLCIGSEGLRLETVESFDSGHGSDHECRHWLHVSDTFRDQPVEDDSIGEWLSTFLDMAEDPTVEVSIEYYSPDAPELLYETPPSFDWATLKWQYE